MPFETHLLNDVLDPKGAPGWLKERGGGDAYGLLACSICCPCITYGATSKLLPASTYCCGGNYVGACLSYFACCVATGSAGAVFLDCLLRNGVAKSKQEKESCCSSLIWAGCCASCSRSQVYKEARIMAQANGSDDQTTTGAPSMQTMNTPKYTKRRQKPQCLEPQIINL